MRVITFRSEAEVSQSGMLVTQSVIT